MTAIKRVHRGTYFEEFTEGRVFVHHWGRTFTAHDGISYSAMTMQYNPLYFNEVYAKELGYRAIPVNPLFVFATALGLSVEDLSEAGGPFLGIDDLAFHAPVYPGDTICARSVVLWKRLSASRPGWGIVEWKTSAANQQDQPVLDFVRRNLVRLRPQPNDH